MRITQAHLEFQVKEINELTGNPKNPYERVNGKQQAQIGNYHLSWSYSGVKLHQMVNKSGGVKDISTGGYGTKKELSHWLGAFRLGLLTDIGKKA